MSQTPLNSNAPVPVVQLTGVCKRFVRGGVTTEVLCRIDLTVDQGSCTLLTGPSGCGKSTLLSILGCVLTPDEGEVRILGQSLERLGPQGRQLLRRDRIGFVFQRFHLLK